MFVIKNMNTGRFVARPGSEYSYTILSTQARMFRTKEEAQEHCCGNEKVIPASTLFAIPSLRD